MSRYLPQALLPYRSSLEVAMRRVLATAVVLAGSLPTLSPAHARYDRYGFWDPNHHITVTTPTTGRTGKTTACRRGGHTFFGRKSVTIHSALSWTVRRAAARGEASRFNGLLGSRPIFSLICGAT